MRKTFVYSFLAVALLTGACKRSEQDKAEAKFEKAQENVKDQAEDMRDEQRDVRDEQKDVVKERQDVQEQAQDLKKAQGELAVARDQYKAKLTQELASVDARIAQLDASGDAKSREKADKLRKQRNDLEARMARIGNEPESNWEQFKGETDMQMEQMKKDSL